MLHYKPHRKYSCFSLLFSAFKGFSYFSTTRGEDIRENPRHKINWRLTKKICSIWFHSPKNRSEHRLHGEKADPFTVNRITHSRFRTRLVLGYLTHSYKNSTISHLVCERRVSPPSSIPQWWVRGGGLARGLRICSCPQALSHMLCGYY